MSITQAAFEKTMASYNEAMHKVFAISPHVESSGNETLPMRWTFAGNLPLKDRVPYITRLGGGHESLFDFGRPKVGGMHYSFFRIHAYAEFPFEVFTWEYGIAACEAYTDDDGNVHPARPAEPAHFRSRTHRITLSLFDRSWGTKQFRAETDTIVRLLDGAPEGIMRQYADAIEKAQAEIAKFNQAIASLHTI